MRKNDTKGAERRVGKVERDKNRGREEKGVEEKIHNVLIRE